MKKISIVLFMLSLILNISGQSLKGDLSSLRNQSDLYITIHFSNLTIDGEKEKAWIKDQLEDKTPEEQNEWLTNWNSVWPDSIYVQEFIEKLNDEIKTLSFKASKNNTAPYTLKITITDIDPGVFAGPFSTEARISGNIKIYQSESDLAIATMEFKHFKGNKYFLTPMMGDRIGNAFATLGEHVGEKLYRVLK